MLLHPRFHTQSSTLYASQQSAIAGNRKTRLSCYRLSAQAIRCRQAARLVSSSGSSHYLALEDDHETEVLKTGRQPMK